MQSFDALCEVQSDKASVEITSPFDGVVKQLLVQEGEIAKVGSGLCLIEVEQDDEHGHDPRVNPDASVTPMSEGRQDPAVSVEEEGGGGERDAKVSVPHAGNKHPLDPTNTASTSFASSTLDHTLATPSVRHFARQQGVDISALTPGSGRDGRIEKKDVEAFIVSGRVVPGVEPQPAVRAEDKDVAVELGRTRYGMWKAMTQVRYQAVISLAWLTILSMLLRVSRYPDSGTRFVWTDDGILTLAQICYLAGSHALPWYTTVIECEHPSPLPTAIIDPRTLPYVTDGQPIGTPPSTSPAIHSRRCYIYQTDISPFPPQNARECHDGMASFPLVHHAGHGRK